MKKLFAVMILIFMTSMESAQANPPEVAESIAKIKQKTFDLNAEAKFFPDEKAYEFLIKDKNISLDWINLDGEKNFFKIKADKEIFSLMGTGLEWNVSLNAVDKNFAVLPSVGINLYARIRPRLDLYTQFSGLPLSNRGHVSDFEAGFRYFPQKNFSVVAGWRRVNFNFRHGGDSSNFNLRGVFASIRYDF